MFAENLEGDELPRLYNDDLETAKNYIYSLVTAKRHSFYGLGRVFTLGQHSVYVSQELERGLEWGRGFFLEILYALREDGLIFVRFFRNPEYKFTLVNNWSVLDNFVGNIIAELPREHLKMCEYKDFLKSDYWKLIQRLILGRDKYTCQHCKAKSKLQVHHKTYRHRGDEIWFREDLITLCKRCHDAEHERGLAVKNVIEEKSIMGYHSNLHINLTVAESANSALLDKLKEGWKQDGELDAEWEKLIFTATLYHEDFDGELKLSYQTDDTALIKVYIELNSTNNTDTVKKEFSDDDDGIEPEEMIQFAAKAVNLGMDLLLLKKQG